MKDKDLDSVRLTKQKLDTVSPSFCLAKWNMSTIYLEQGETHSCYHPKRHKIPLQEVESDPSALHNTEFKKEQRKMMLEGQRPKECQYCWNIEDLNKNFISDRMLHSSEYWNEADFEKIKNLPWQKNINPRQIEVSFDNVCQMKCVYCNPAVSSKWLEEIKTYGGYKTSKLFNELSAEEIQQKISQRASPDNAYVRAFWKWWPDLYPEVRIFRITGGEPLLSAETFKVLDYIMDHPHPQLEVIINSNLCVADELITKLIQKAQMILDKKCARKFTVYTSLDTVGEQAEYIRTGLSYERIMKNVQRILTEVPQSVIGFNVTYNALSLLRFKFLLEEFKSLRAQHQSFWRAGRVMFDAPYLRFPDHLSIQVLPKSFVSYFDEQIRYIENNLNPMTGFSEIELLKLKGVREWMLAPTEDRWLEQSRRDFKIYFTEHDKRKNTDFLRTFPELTEFYNGIKL
ncbi:MAG: twitch domain-containing radical SAM protein [Pseudobdellovibrio sp.]